MENTAPAISKNAFEFENVNGDVLGLHKIVNSKCITLLKFSYRTKKRRVRAKGLKGFFGAKVEKQDTKEAIISDTNGITLNYDEKLGTVRARFSNKKEFKRINNLDCDETTLRSSYVMNSVKPYLVMFHIQNLKQVFWKNK